MAGKLGSSLLRVVPLLRQLRGYRRQWVASDVLAGLSVAAVALPTAIAYPAIAGLPVEAGLYAAILPAVGYALFGPSRLLMVGPDTATTMVLASALLSLGISGADERVATAAALAVATGMLCILAGLLRFGFVANFLSRPILVGFLAGVALGLLSGQIGRMTGVRIEADGFVAPLLELASKLDQIHIVTLLAGIGLFVLLRAMRTLYPAWPGPLIAIAASMAASFALNLKAYGTVMVGAISASLPPPALNWPTGVAADDLLLAAMAILLVSFGSGIITARSFGAKYHYDVDGNRELVGFGAANIASGLFSGFPVTSSDSRTAVNTAVGAKTQVAGLVSAAALAATVAYVGEALAFLPVAALGAVLASAAVDLVDVKALRMLWRIDRVEFGLAIFTVVGVVALGVLKGVILAVGATLAYLLWVASRPRDALLGQIPGKTGLYKLHQRPEARTVPGLTLFLVQSGLVFFNTDYVKGRILEILDGASSRPRWLVLDASAVNHLDSTAVEALEDLRAVLARRGIAFGIAGLHHRPEEIVERSGLARDIGRGMIFSTSEDAVAAFRARETV